MYVLTRKEGEWKTEEWEEEGKEKRKGCEKKGGKRGQRGRGKKGGRKGAGIALLSCLPTVQFLRIQKWS